MGSTSPHHLPSSFFPHSCCLVLCIPIYWTYALFLGSDSWRSQGIITLLDVVGKGNMIFFQTRSAFGHTYEADYSGGKAWGGEMALGQSYDIYYTSLYGIFSAG